MEVKVTGTIGVYEYCSADIDFHDNYNSMLMWYGIDKVEVDGVEVKPEYKYDNKAIHRLLSCFSKPWIIHRGKTISGYERTYIVPDNEPGCPVFVVSIKESSRILNQKMADYILWNDKVIEADDENELFIDKWYDEIIIKR